MRRFKGVMAAYPLIDDTDDLTHLDEWILDRLWLAVRKRGHLLTAAGLGPLPIPHGTARAALRGLSATSARTGSRIDLTVPSVRRIARVISDAASQYGPAVVGKASVYDY